MGECKISSGLQVGNQKLKAKIDLIDQRLNKEAEERRKDIYDCAVKLLTEMKLMAPNQNLVFKKHFNPFI